MVRARIGYGPTCQALIDFLEKDGHKVSYVFPATGAWRHVRMDVMSWEMHILTKDRIEKGLRLERSIGCWESITKFLKKAKKYGYHIDDNDEIWAKEEE